MQMKSLKRSTAEIMSFPQSVQVLRRWCTPDTILVITDLLDEDALLFHIVKQAQGGTAKIILIQASHPHSRLSPSPSFNPRQVQQSLSFRFAQLVLARMARKLRWVGLNCEPVLNKAFSLAEIRTLVQLRAVDRIIITAKDGQNGLDIGWRVFRDHLLRNIEVPVCIIGNQAATDFGGERHSGRVSLALSLDSDNELALAFASRFAQEHHLRLTLMHVFSQKETNPEQRSRSISAVASRLPAPTLREAELLCPLEISVSEGDPAAEILRYDLQTNQDFIILRSAGSARSSWSDEESIAHKVIRGATCPVIILGQPAKATVHEREGFAAKPKTPAAVNSSAVERQGEQAEECA